MRGASSNSWRNTAATLAWLFAGLGLFGNALDAFGVDGHGLFLARYAAGFLFAVTFLGWLGIWLFGRYAERRRPTEAHDS